MSILAKTFCEASLTAVTYKGSGGIGVHEAQSAPIGGEAFERPVDRGQASAIPQSCLLVGLPIGSPRTGQYRTIIIAEGAISDRLRSRGQAISKMQADNTAVARKLRTAKRGSKLPVSDKQGHDGWAAYSKLIVRSISQLARPTARPSYQRSRASR